MTTQNTHHEPNDVDASVVEHQPVPENTVTPSTFESVMPDGTEIQAGILASDEPATPVESQIEVPQETPTLSEVSTTLRQKQHVTSEQEDLPQNASSPEALIINETAPGAGNSSAPEEAITASMGADVSLAETKGDEIRPFTDFIEEFRLAEEARLNTSRQEIQAAPMEPLATEIGTFNTEADGIPLSSTSYEVASTAQTRDSEEFLNQENATPSTQQQLIEEAAKETPVIPPTPTVRAVSPLLRPATRLRVPRHAAARHIREESVVEKVESAPTPAPTPFVAMPQPEPSTPIETSKETEQPRPPRRYRFDRPASTANKSTNTAGAIPAQSPTPVFPHIEEKREKDTPNHDMPALTEVTQNGNDQLLVAPTITPAKPTTSNTRTESAPAATPIIEAFVPKQSPEVPTVENTNTPSTAEHGRRRQGQERQKEQPVAISTTDAISPVIEPAIQSSEVAPEDLPPLEYAELQKASTRRRRRHRPGTNNNGSSAAETPIIAPQPVQVAPIVPVPLVMPIPAITPVMPLTPNIPMPPVQPAASGLPATAHPTAPGLNGNQYTIVSGYTVNQMNQGNEVAGPFMGPEPSPARGSVVTQNGRTIRAEAQRSPIYPPARTHESGPSSASLNHFATAISQAIQTQTDRMVAEMRRNSQAPTNVSVTLPPFPSTERVGVFVDVANLLYSARTLRIGVDFGKLLDFLRGNRRLIRAHAYCPTSPQAGDEQMFLQAVKGLGYRITTKNYKTFSSGAKKADLDLDLCMDVVRIVDGGAVDCIVLVSGDSDFMPMLDYCSDHGVRVEVAAFDEAMSATLRQSCDLFINLSMLEEIRA